MVNHHQHLHQEADRANKDNVTSTGGTVLTVIYVTTDKPTFTNVIIGQPTTTDFNPAATTQQAVQSSDEQQPSQQAGAPNSEPSSTDSPSIVNFATQTSDSSNQQTAASSYQPTNLYTASAASSPTYAMTSSNYYSNSHTNTAVNAASTNSSTGSGSSSGGMSIGAKAGIAGGIIGAIGLMLVLALFCLKRKQRNHEEDQAKDAEKSDFLDSRAAPTPSTAVSVTNTSAAAPRLSLRPASSFLPEFIGGARNRNSQGNMLNAAGGPGARNKPGMLNQQASLESINEKPGSRDNPFKDPENPFADRKAFTPRSGPMSGPAPAKGMAPVAATVAGGMAVGAIAAAATKSQPSKESLSDASTNSSQPRQDTNFMPPASSVPSSKPESVHSESPAGVSNMTPVPGPRPESPSPSNVYRILMDFTPSMEDELELRAGQLVRLLHEYDDGWCLCTRLDRSQQGAVPRTCLAAKPSKPRPHPGGPGMGRPMSPASMGRPMSPASMGRAMTPMGDPRAMSPTMGRAMSPSMGGLDERMNSPIDRAMSPSMGRPIGNMSSTMGRPMSPDDMAGFRNGAPSPQGRMGASRPLSPGAYNRLPRPLSPGPVPQKRSASPGPYGHAGGPPPMTGVQHRRRSNSAGALYLQNGRDSPSGQGRYVQGMGIAL